MAEEPENALGSLWDALAETPDEAKTPTLADLGKWPRTKLGSHAAIRHAYENVTTSSARLFSFSTGRAPTSDGPIADQQTLLASDDLVAFAIHGRRLIENTISGKRARHVLVPVATKDAKQYIPITKLINALIHHRDILILRTEQEVRIWSGVRRLEDFLIANRKSIKPICFVTSEKESIMFRIEEMVEVFQEKILEQIINLCAENRLWLERME
jgi:hypothetical protein